MVRSTSNTSKIDTTFQNTESSKREQEKLLEEELHELSTYEDSFRQTLDLTDQMIALLSSFEDRLAYLEPTIVPINKSTQKLKKIQDNLDKTSSQLSTVIGYMDLLDKQDNVKAIKNPEDDLPTYLDSTRKIIEAFLHLQQNAYGNSQNALTEMRGTLERNYLQLCQLLKKWVASVSSPLDGSLYDGKEIPIPGNQIVQNMQNIIAELRSIHTVKDGSQESTKDPLHYKIYSDVRSEFLIKSIQPLYATAAQSVSYVGPNIAGGADGGNDGGNDVSTQAGNLLTAVLNVGSSKANNNLTSPLQGYTKKSSAFLPYSRVLLRLLRAEKDLVQRVFSKKQSILVYQLAVASVLNSYFEASESLLQRVKRNVISRKDFSSADPVYIMLDCVDCLQPLLKEYDGVLAYAGLKGNAVGDFFSGCRTTALLFLKEQFDDLNVENQKQQQMPADGTVHELSSVTVNLVKNILEYQTILDNMLADGLGLHVGLSFTSFQLWVKEVLEALIKNMERKSQFYMKSNKLVLVNIFLMNNYHYIQKSVKASTKLTDLLGVEFEDQIQKLVSKHKDVYVEGWKPLCGYLMDLTMIQNGSIQKTLSKQQKDDVKDKFKNFNTGFDERFQAQKTYSVPDPDMRFQLIKDIKKVIVPMYGRFHDKYTEIEFSKNPSKYIVYDKRTLEETMDKFFDASA